MTQTAGESAREPENVWRSRKTLLVVTSCVTILGLLGMGVTAFYVVEQRAVNAQQRAYVDCQKSYNESVAQAIRERGAAGDQDRMAIRAIAQSGVEMIKVILDPASTQDRRVAAIQKWQQDQIKADQDLRDADEKRKQNPIPGPTQC